MKQPTPKPRQKREARKLKQPDWERKRGGPQLIGPMVKTQLIDNRATGEHMRQLRLARFISLRAFAKRLGVSAPYLSDLERGNRNWTQARIDQWEEAASGQKRGTR